MIKINNIKISYLAIGMMVFLFGALIFYKLYFNVKKPSKKSVNNNLEHIISPTTIPIGFFDDYHAYINKNSNLIDGAFDFSYSGQANDFFIDINTTSDFAIGKYWPFTNGKNTRLRDKKQDIDNQYTCFQPIYWRIRADNQSISPIQQTIVYCSTDNNQTNFDPQEADKMNRDNVRIRDLGRLESILIQYIKANRNKLVKTKTTSINNLTDCKDNWTGLDLCKYSKTIPADPINQNTYVTDLFNKISIKLAVYRLNIDNSGDYRICSYFESKNNSRKLIEDGLSNDFYEVYSTHSASLCGN